MTDPGPAAKAKYEPLTNPEKLVKDQPPTFRWLKYEPQVLLTIVVVWATYLCYDLAKANRRAAANEKIVGLEEGYFGIQRDHNDAQWGAWRDNLGLLLTMLALHLGIGALIKKATAESLSKTGILIFNMVFGLAFIGYLEQSGTIYWLLLSGLFYLVISVTYRWRIFPVILWSSSLLTLYLNETFSGYGFEFISKDLHENMVHAPVRWNVLFNMTILRMISFGMDKYWATSQKPVSQKTGEILSYRQRQEIHQPLKNYNLLAYYAYLLYVPLYLTGPIISFNAWISQIYISQKEYSNADIVKYGLRFIFCFICFEAFLHLFYVNALSTREANVHIWKKYFHETQHILLMSMLELFFLWFKFLIIWRFARLWALIDGIESPENMNRCVANNYSFEGFWRSWHRSFNQWLIRYIFIPLGGSKYKFYNVWVVFGFVAIWHDMNLNLLLWSWIICLSLMPEMLIKFYFHQRKNRYLWDKLWFRYGAAVLATILILCMIIANLIGYGTGRELLVVILKQVEENREYGIIIGTFLLIFCHSNVLFKLREWEAEKGQAAKF